MTKLERLHLAGTQLDDAGVAQLSQLPALRYVDLSNCEVSAETVDKLHAANSGLELKVN